MRPQFLQDGKTTLYVLTLLQFSPVPYCDTRRVRFRSPQLFFNSIFPTFRFSRQYEQGQANAARDKLYDLRECQLSGVRGNEFDLSGVIMSKTDVSKAMFREAQFSKGYLRDSNFDGADFTNAIVDRANFKGSSLRGTIFKNAVLTATSFEGADVGECCCLLPQSEGFSSHSIFLVPHLIGEHRTFFVRKRRLY
jgi:uncharacterized protein YjbI with pentapeptide repeats